MYNIVENNEISISSELWNKLNDEFTKEEIKELIHNAIDINKIPMPLRDITYNDMLEDFHKLCDMNVNDLYSNDEWFTRYEYKYDLLYNNESMLFKTLTTGNKASDYFHQYSRWLCDSVNSPSPYRSWNNKKFRDGFLNALWTMKMKKVGTTELRSAIALRKYIASQFRCSTAKGIYDFYSAKNVLDLSSGWGDRLAGFYSSKTTQTYTGFDPNERLINGYNEQINEYNSIIQKNAKIYNIGAEYMDDVLCNEKYDLIFTSPPYFNIERYTQENTQSYKKYKKIDNWLNEFLFDIIEKSWKYLEPNGILAINISDVYSGHKVNKICDPMNDFIRTLPLSEYIGAIGYEMAKRPNSGALKNKTGKFAEPIWCWRKCA